MKKFRSAVLVSLSAAAAACGTYAAAGGTGNANGGSTGSSNNGGSINSSNNGGSTSSADTGGSISSSNNGGAIGSSGSGAVSTGGIGASANGGPTASGGSSTSGGNATASGGSSASGGSAPGGAPGTGGSTAAPPGPCDVLKNSGNPCVAAHSTVRALSSTYNGNLYQVKNSSGTKDIPVLSPGGYANAAVQDQFCTSACTISIIYDQSGKGNNLTPAPAGGAKPTADNPANATDLKLTIAGHSAYGVLIKPGMGYRKLVASGTAVGDDPETEYMVSSQLNLVNECCFDYGNAETSAHDDGNGTMEAVYLGNGVIWGTGVQGGPWVMSDLENGLFAGWDGDDQNIASNTPLKFNYVTALIVGWSATAQTGGRFANYGGDATSGVLKTMYDGIRPAKAGYVPMKKQGSVILGIGGDNSASGGGRWYEGVMATGAATKATVDAIQANIVAAGYGK